MAGRSDLPPTSRRGGCGGTNSKPPRPQLSWQSSAVTRFTASGCSPMDSHKVAQGHGGGVEDRRGCSSGGPGTCIPAFLRLGADSPRHIGVWAARHRGCHQSDVVTCQIFFFRACPGPQGKILRGKLPVPYPTASPIHFLHPSRDLVLGPRALPGQASGLLAQDLVS